MREYIMSVDTLVSVMAENEEEAIELARKKFIELLTAKQVVFVEVD